MIMVAASLAMIGILQLAIGPDVLFGDTIQRQQVAVFDDCQTNGFQEPQWAKWLDDMQLQECRENKDIESDECQKYRTWVIADQELEDILKNAHNEEWLVDLCDWFIPEYSQFLRWGYVYTVLMIIEAGSLWLPKGMMSLVLFERRIMKHNF